MATNRYGQIYHGDHHHINIRFPSTEARLKFQNEFEAYHQAHDHEGDIPTFKCVSSKDLKLSTGSRSPQDLVKAETDENYRITIDGYSWNEIHEYHNPTGWKDSFWYSVPTCCVPPIIVIDHKFVDAGTLQRHELSAIFGDMPEQDYKSLLESVQRDGFIDDTIKLLDGQLLDGWHRYRAAQELNLIRKLRFQEWNEDAHRDGDPKAFVLARNIERRHFIPSQRAQIVVSFNERFGQGVDPRSLKSPNGEFKTRQELAQEAGVGKRTIDRAVAVEKVGESEAVIAGEKTAGEVLKDQKQARLTEARINANKALDKMWEIFHASELTNCVEPDDFVKAACEHHRNWGVDDIPEQEDTDIPEIWEARFNLLTTQIQTRSIWITEFIGEETDKDTGEPLKEREGSKLRKQKKQTAKLLWDTRIQVARDYTGDADTELNLHLTLPDLEKGFVKHNPTYADAFESAMKRTTETSFNIVLEKVLASDIDVEALQTEYRAMMTYAGDVRNWQRADWSPDTNWILPLIEAKQSKSVTVGETEVSPASETETEAAIAVVKPRFQDAVETWRSSQVERLRKFEVLPVGRTPLIESEYLKTYFELAQPRIQQNTKPTAAHYEGAIECMLDLPVAFAEQLQGRHYRRIIKEWDQSVLLQLVERFQSGHILGYPALQTDSDANAARIRKAIRDHYDFPSWLRITTQPFEVLFEITEDAHAILVQLNPKEWIREGQEISWAVSLLPEVVNTEEAPAEDEPDMNALWDAFNKRYPKWKAKYAESGYKENDLIQASTETEMLDALRVYRETESERKGKPKGKPTADEVKDMTDLMSQQSYPFARCLRDLLRAKGISDWTQQHQQTLESVQKFKEKLKAFGASDDLVDDSLHFYHGLEEADLCTSPQETLKKLNEFLQGFIDKPLPEWPEWIRNQVPEGDAAGFPGIDIQAMRNTLSSLLQSLGIDDSHRGLQESLGGDLLDVFLQYEELPTEKEQLIALLNTADAILSEMIP